MPIRFRCENCHEDIEVDERWASRDVVCPFCQSMAPAPPESIPEGGPDPPRSESEESGILELGGMGTGPGRIGRPTTTGGAVSIAALVLVLASFSINVLAAAIIAGESDRIQVVTQGMYRAMQSRDTEELVRLQGELLRIPGVGGSLVLFAGSAVAWLASIGCGLIGLRGVRRRTAVAALALAAIPPIMFIAGTVCGPGGPAAWRAPST